LRSLRSSWEEDGGILCRRHSDKTDQCSTLILRIIDKERLDIGVTIYILKPQTPAPYHVTSAFQPCVSKTVTLIVGLNVALKGPFPFPLKELAPSVESQKKHSFLQRPASSCDWQGPG
jgi:hypothetical protein